VNSTVGKNGQIKEDKTMDKLHHLGKQVESKSEKIPVLVDSLVLWAIWTMKYRSLNLLSDRKKLNPCPTCSSSLHYLHYLHPGRQLWSCAGHPKSC